ncbi:MAG: deoxyribonuclease IV [Firmicutes bacterium]|nr:deoxyribonuclease IV [Bacillota bacterium]
MILGSHCSLKAPDYFLGSIKEALSYGANTCMVYTGPPSNSKRKSAEDFKIEEAQSLMKKNGMAMEHIVIHAPYIINLANSKKPETAQFGVEFLKEELKRVEQMGAKILVLHPGSHVQAGADIGLEWIVRGLNEVLKEDESDVKIALETMAGKGAECGRTFEELAYIYQNIEKKERIGFCFDTCHTWDAGYDLNDFDQVIQQFDEILGIENILVFHINDSKNPLGAHKDRHENIGKGYIGFEILHEIVHDPRFENVPKILETPYIDSKAPYKEEIEMLKEM